MIKNISLLIAILFPLHTYASLDLSLKETIVKALSEDETVKIKNGEIEKTEYAYKEARGAIFPHLQAEAVWQHNAKVPVINFGGMNVGVTKDYESSLSLTATQTLWAFGRISQAIALAHDALSMQEHFSDVSKRETRFNAEVFYYTVLLAEKSLDIARDSLENARKNRDLLNVNFSAGRPAQKDNIKMAADIAARIPAVKKAESDLDLAKISFRTLLNISRESDIRLTDSFRRTFPVFSEKQLQSELDSNEPTLKALRMNVSLRDKALQIRKASFLPTVGAFGLLSYSGNSDSASIGKKNFNTIAAVGVKINIPLDTGGEIYHTMKQAALERANSELEYKKTAKQISLGLSSAISSYNSLIETLKANREAVRLASLSFANARERFRSGKATLSELNDSEILLTSQKLEETLSLYRIHTSMAKIRQFSSQAEDL